MQAKTDTPARTCSEPTQTHPCVCRRYGQYGRDLCNATACVERRSRRVDRLKRNRAAQRLAAVLATLEAAADELRDLTRGHGPGHKGCALCQYLPDELWDDVVTLRVNIEVGACVLESQLPGSLNCGVPARDETQGG